VPWVDIWYGNDALWTRLPPTGVLPALGEADSLSTKFPWWRIIPGRLTLQARRLDGPSDGFSGESPSSGYGALGFIPSGLRWPDTGCWQVTGTVSGHSLTFTVWVQHFPEYP
jgi:hypothetical protein